MLTNSKGAERNRRKRKSLTNLLTRADNSLVKGLTHEVCTFVKQEETIIFSLSLCLFMNMKIVKS
jgi:hypothetical protein